MGAFEQESQNGTCGLLAGGAAGGDEPRVAALGVVLQALVADGRQVERMVRQVRERGQQRRVLALLRGDLQRATRVDLALGTGAACALGAGIRCCSCRHRPARSPTRWAAHRAPSGAGWC